MCDTFVALSRDELIFGKNSDREPGEAQALEYHPGREHRRGDKLDCTYIQIPQAEKTYGVLLSRPFWMWGAEMGANEKGVTIGNEAVWTRMPAEKQGRLLGMDLLRLALERAGTAEEGVEVLIRLLSDFGQGGPCGYSDKKMVYHNSFIIADPDRAWVFETAGPLWAALKVKDHYSISNRLTIGAEFDRAHPNLIDTARKKGWLKPGRDFNFARCYSDWFFSTFSGSKARRRRSGQALSQNRQMDIRAALDLLRDHGRDDYRPDSHFLHNSLCGHAANALSRHAVQTTGSLAARLGPKQREFWATGASAPCLNLFKPIWFEDRVLPDLGPRPGPKYDPKSYWWQQEKLHRMVLMDFARRSRIVRETLLETEPAIIKKARLAEKGRRFEITDQAFSLARKKTRQLWAELEKTPSSKPAKRLYRNYWNKQNRYIGMDEN